MINDKTVLAIIPARGGSKSVPRKNLRIIQGKSLLKRTIETARQSKYIDKLILSSEDADIIHEAKLAGADVPFVRPHELADDSTPGIAPILHALNVLPYYDYVIVLQPTSPLRKTIDIDMALAFCDEHAAPACVSVCQTSESPYWMFHINNKKTLTPILDAKIPVQRQDLPPTYLLNGAIYIALTHWLQINKSFLSNETLAYIMPIDRSLDIDTEEDLTRLSHYLKEEELSNV